MLLHSFNSLLSNRSGTPEFFPPAGKSMEVSRRAASAQRNLCAWATLALKEAKADSSPGGIALEPGPGPTPGRAVALSMQWAIPGFAFLMGNEEAEPH